MSLDLTPGIYHGVLVEVVEAEGTGLVGDHAAGATLLTVGSGGAFGTAGSCDVDGTVYAYTRDGDDLTITPGLVADAEDGTPVVSLGNGARPDTRLEAVVDLDLTDETDEDYPHATIPGEWASYYTLGDADAGAMVRVVDTPDGYELVGRPHDAPLLDAGVIDPSTLGNAGIAHQSAVDAIEDDIAAINGQIVDMPRTVYATARPTVEAGEVVVWYDSDNGYAAERWDGTAWTPVKWGEAALADGSILGRHFTGLTFQGVAITGALLQTTATANRGIKMTSAGLIGYDTTGAARTVIDPTTGLISARGTLQSVATNGTAVSMSTAANAFQSGQNWALVEFTPGIAGWGKGLIWGWDDGSSVGALRLSSPNNPAAGGDAWLRAAVLDLRATSAGATSAQLYADSLEVKGNTFQITSANGSPADFNVFNTHLLQFQHLTADNRLAIGFGTVGTVTLKAADKSGNTNWLTLQSERLSLEVTGIETMYLYQVGTAPHFGRADGAAGISFHGGSPGETASRNWLNGLVPHVAFSHPTSSDEALKRNIVALDRPAALAMVRGLPAAEFDWIQDRGHSRGFIAQQVREVLPFAVSGQEGELSVDPYPLLGTLWAAVQDLADRLDNLTAPGKAPRR